MNCIYCGSEALEDIHEFSEDELYRVFRCQECLRDVVVSLQGFDEDDEDNELFTTERCPRCSGTGRGWDMQELCLHCGGEGYIDLK